MSGNGANPVKLGLTGHKRQRGKFRAATGGG
jgi:hypothetical protein